MASLAGMIERLEAWLMDSANLVWDAATLTEGLRLALGEYNLAGGGAETISGLDGAGSSALPAAHEGMLIVGAAGYAALARSVDRAESFQMGSESGALRGWAEARLVEFRAMLGFAHPAYAGGESSSVDPARAAAELALLAAQANEGNARAAEAGARAAESTARAVQLAAQTARAAAEAERLRAQRMSANPAWGTWHEEGEADGAD